MLKRWWGKVKGKQERREDTKVWGRGLLGG